MNEPTTTAALHPTDTIDMPEIIALLKKKVPVSPIKEATRAQRRQMGRNRKSA